MCICDRANNKRRKSSGLSMYILEERLIQWSDIGSFVRNFPIGFDPDYEYH